MNDADAQSRAVLMQSVLAHEQRITELERRWDEWQRHALRIFNIESTDTD